MKHRTTPAPCCPGPSPDQNQSPPTRAAISFNWRQRIGLGAGPLVLVLTLLLPTPEGLTPEAWLTVGVAGFMAIWWICESVPIPITALLPIVLIPLGGLAPVKEVMPAYADPIVYLFLGGFMLALAMEHVGLHRRIALTFIGAVGIHPRRIIGGFLIISALLSMWVSNTATTLMMLPIALSVLTAMPDSAETGSAHPPFKTAVLLAVAYGATTGGMGTLIGTPPNALMAAFVQRTYGVHIGFGQWMLLGVPIVLIALPVVYWLLTRVAFRIDSAPLQQVESLIADQREKLGPLRGPERVVAIVSVLTALSWIFRPLLRDLFPYVSDTSIAILGASILFIIPDHQRGGFVMNWDSAKRLPWDVLLLFGGGLALAGQVQSSGLSLWLGDQAGSLAFLPIMLIVAVVSLGILFLTELTSNTATAATFLPVVATVAVSLGQHPLLLLIPTALAANCAYMMPVGTPPNAIVFGSGLVPLQSMVRAGVLLNLLLVPIIIAVLWVLGPLVFDFHIAARP